MTKLTLNEDTDLTTAAKEFQHQADANQDLRTYETASRKVVNIMNQLEKCYQQIEHAPNKEAKWDIKDSARYQKLKQDLYYWQGEKRDILIEQQIAAMNRLTAALEKN